MRGVISGIVGRCTSQCVFGCPIQSSTFSLAPRIFLFGRSLIPIRPACLHTFGRRCENLDAENVWSVELTHLGRSGSGSCAPDDNMCMPAPIIQIVLSVVSLRCSVLDGQSHTETPDVLKLGSALRSSLTGHCQGLQGLVARRALPPFFLGHSILSQSGSCARRTRARIPTVAVRAVFYGRRLLQALLGRSDRFRALLALSDRFHGSITDSEYPRHRAMTFSLCFTPRAQWNVHCRF